MSLRRKVTGALAWAGLVIVIAVPAAETVSSKLVPAVSGASVVSARPAAAALPAKQPLVGSMASAPIAVALPARKLRAPPTQIAAAASPIKPEAVGDDKALEEYLASGKRPPGYTVSGTAPAPAVAPAAAKASAPVSAVGAPSMESAQPKTAAPATVAATKPVAPAVVAPPAAAAPATVAATKPVAPAVVAPPAAAAPALAAAPEIAAAPALAARPVAPTTAADVASVPPVPPVPPVPLPASARPRSEPEPTVTEADLKNWKSGSLEDYLKQQGLLSDTEPAGN